MTIDDIECQPQPQRLTAEPDGLDALLDALGFGITLRQRLHALIS